MSLIRDSLKKVQEKEDPNDKTVAVLPDGPKSGKDRKKSPALYALIGIGVLLIGLVYFLLYQTTPERPARPLIAASPKSSPGVESKSPAGQPAPAVAPASPAAQEIPGGASPAKAPGPAGPTPIAPPKTRATLPPSPVVPASGEVREARPAADKKAATLSPALTTAGADEGPVPAKTQAAGRVRSTQAGFPPKAKADREAVVPGSGPAGGTVSRDRQAQEALKKSYDQAYAWQQEGKIELAQARYRDILSQDPHNPYVLTNLGLLSQKTGRLKEALPYFEKALESDPRFVPAAQNLGLVWLKLNNGEEATRWLERSLALEPNNAVTLTNLGILYKKQGNRELARQYLKRSLTIDPRLPEVHYNLARLEEEAGNIPDAYRFYREFIRLRNDPADRLVQDVQRHVRDWKVPGPPP